MYSEVLFKVVDTSLVGLYFFFGGILISDLINKITITYGDMNKKDIKKISTLTVFYHLCKEIVLITIFAYILQNIIKHIPFYIHKFKKYKGYDSLNLEDTFLLEFALISYINQDLDNKLNTFLTRLGIKENEGNY
jgi:nucleoside permease NupC